MNTAKGILYDLAIAGIAMSGWLIPSSAKLDLIKSASIATSLVFSARAYYTGVTLLAKERMNDEKKGIAYEAEMEILDSSMTSLVENTLEIKALEFENKALQLMLPLVQENKQLQHLLSRYQPTHPELSEEDKEQAARSAIEGAFVESESKSDRSTQISEEDIRAKYPESLDNTTWKAICKALGNGATKEEILKEVLTDSSELGRGYFELLKSKFFSN
jgi:hypothetical protein